ncbi:MAG: DUF1294 domain-containing protein [Alloprevotella sp.]|nr:DUF1294 domain-containing protein [Alloprevotella sp.]
MPLPVDIPQFALCAYLLLANLAAFIAYGVDKHRARRHAWRIPEATLLGLAAIGGSLGAWLGMKTFYHKTLHWKFRIVVPLLLFLHAVLLYYISGL